MLGGGCFVVLLNWFCVFLIATSGFGFGVRLLGVCFGHVYFICY